MKSVFALLLAVTASTAVHGQNLINGDFETGSLPPWTTNGWVVDTVNPNGGRYCARDTGGHWLRQDFEPLAAWSTCVFFRTRQTGPSSPTNLDVLYSDSTSQQVRFSPSDEWSSVLVESLLDCRKTLTGLRFWGAPGNTMFLDDIAMPWRCVTILYIISPGGEARVGHPVTPRMRVRGELGACRAWIWMKFWHETLHDEYWDSAWVSFSRHETTLRFRDWVPRYAGWYRFFCSTDPSCTTYWRIIALDSTGVAEDGFVPPAQVTRLQNVLASFHPSPADRRADFTVCSASGAVVWRGPVEHAALSPGVYFVEAAGRRERIVLVR